MPCGPRFGLCVPCAPYLHFLWMSPSGLWNSMWKGCEGKGSPAWRGEEHIRAPGGWQGGKELSKDHIQLVTFKAKMRLPLILSWTETAYGEVLLPCSPCSRSHIWFVWMLFCPPCTPQPLTSWTCCSFMVRQQLRDQWRKKQLLLNGVHKGLGFQEECCEAVWHIVEWLGWGITLGTYMSSSSLHWGELKHQPGYLH